MNAIEIRDLRKTYPSFTLKDISFDIPQGKITGFVGRNGAGKSTTIKAMLNLIHPDSGQIIYFSKPLSENEREIKKIIGYSTGSINWYPRRKIRDIVSVTRSFYPSWDDESYEHYRKLFDIDENKTPSELSDGMKVKLNILLALSHRAKALILDEPTSTLDPFSREEILSCFKALRDRNVAVFFSTHIISDLEKCADNITVISDGRILASCPKDDFLRDFAHDGMSLEDAVIALEKEVRV